MPPGSGGLNFPNGLLFAPDGRLYVASQNGNQVLRYDANTGAFLDVFSEVPGRPHGLSLSSAGSLFVGNFVDETRIFEISSGSLLTTFVGGPYNELAPDGTVWVARAASNIDRYTPSGAYIDTVISDPILLNASGMAFQRVPESSSLILLGAGLISLSIIKGRAFLHLKQATRRP